MEYKTDNPCRSSLLTPTYKRTHLHVHISVQEEITTQTTGIMMIIKLLLIRLPRFIFNSIHNYYLLLLAVVVVVVAVVYVWN